MNDNDNNNKTNIEEIKKSMLTEKSAIMFIG